MPLSLLNQLDPAAFSWQVPGLRQELATELIRSLPKAVRRHFAPAPDFARRSLDWLAAHPADRPESLPPALGRALRILTGELVDPGRLGPGRGPGPPAGQLRRAGGRRARRRPAGHGQGSRRAAGRARPPADPDPGRGGRLAHPDRGHPVGVRDDRGAGHAARRRPRRSSATRPWSTRAPPSGSPCWTRPRRQAASHRAGLRRLVLLNTPGPDEVGGRPPRQRDKLALAAGPYASVPELLADARLASVASWSAGPGSWCATRPAFRALCDAVRVDNPELMQAIVRLAAEVLTARRGAAGRAARGCGDQSGRRRRPDRAAGQPGLPGLPGGHGVRASDAPAALPAGGRSSGSPVCGPTRPGTRPGWPRSCAARTRTPSWRRGAARTAARLRRRGGLAAGGAAGQPVRPERCGRRSRCRRSGCAPRSTGRRARLDEQSRCGRSQVDWAACWIRASSTP